MTKETLLKMDSNNLIQKLNKQYSEKPLKILDLFNNSEKEEFEGLCADCLFKTAQKKAFDESLTWCENCQSLEASTVEVTKIDTLKVAYNWKTKNWFVPSDDLGSGV